MKKAKFKDIKPIPLEAEIDGRGVYIKAAIDTIYEETLIICVYAIEVNRKKEGYTCIFQQFITENDFVAINYHDSDVGKWSNSTLFRFIESKIWYFDIENRYGENILKCATEQDNDVINKYYQTKFSVGVNLVNNHQTKLRESALYYKHDIERRELMRIHDQAICLPSNLNDWINDVIAKDNAKYFYETEKKSKLKQGICSYCKVESTIKIAKHNDYGLCPNCSSKVQFKGLNRAKYYSDYDYFAFAQRIDSGIMIRRFKVKLDYKRPDKKTDIKNTDIILNESSRSVLEESKSRSYHYEFGEFKKQEYRWKKEDYSYAGYYYGSDARSTRNTYMRLYPFNLKDVITGTKWEYCAIEMFRGKIDPMDYFEFEESKILEMVVRRGFNNLANDMINSNYNSQIAIQKIEQTKLMGLSEHAFFMAKTYDLGLKEFEIMRLIENTYHVKPNIEQIKWIANVHSEFSRVLNILEFSSIQKTINYINKKSFERNANAKDILIEWDDYLQTAATLKYNLKNDILLYPRDLAKRHDEVIKKANANKDKSFELGVKRIYKKFMWLNFSKFGLVIKVAKDIKEISKESEELGHCVGRGTSYIERMSKGKTLILTIRKAETPDIPYFTLEINPHTFEVRQYESINRLRKSDEIDKFLKEWEKQVIKKLVGPKKTNNIRRIHEHRIAN